MKPIKLDETCIFGSARNGHFSRLTSVLKCDGLKSFVSVQCEIDNRCEEEEIQ